MSSYDVYRGSYPCKWCGSLKTGTSTIATSERFIRFWCDDCVKGKFKGFAVLASRVSSLSKYLQRVR